MVSTKRETKPTDQEYTPRQRTPKTKTQKITKKHIEDKGVNPFLMLLLIYFY